MKTIYTTPLIYFLTLPLFSNATVYVNNGIKVNYTLNYGDTLKITSGSYKGKILTFTNGAVIVVSASAIFDPESFGTPNGKVINYGTCTFSSLGTYSGFKFENYNLFKATGNVSLYDGNTQTWNNNVAASMQIDGDLSMNNAVFTNYANMTVGGDLSLYTSTSNLINRGVLTIEKDINMSNGILLNQNKIYVEDVNAWAGQLTNQGSISPEGDLTFSNGSNYTNSCLMVSNKGFTNYGTFTNNGMLWVGRTGSNDDHFYNSGTFTNAANAVVRTRKFTNYSVINGGGSYYISSDSYSSGTVGKSGITTDSIKVYDVTRANSSRIFDVQWGTVNANVVYRQFAEPDTTKVSYSGCSIYYKLDMSGVLPVEWNYFTAKLVNNQPVLNWSAQYEAAMQFEIERSFDNVKFSPIGQQISTSSKTYSYTDAKLQNNIVVYYRIKATSALNGSVKYTETKTVKTNGIASSVSVYPNPVKQTASLQYVAEKNQALLIRISNTAGQQVIMKNVNAVKGANVITLAETSQLKSGAYFVEIIGSSAVVATQQFIKN